jgi:HK97 family phage prohead protease
MQHITKAATVTATTDKGEFTAVIAAYNVDRVGDQIAFGAFEKTIAAWRASGKRIPLHWDHRSDPQYIIGSFDPATMEEIDGKGLVASGTVDLENSEIAREAWRAMKTGSMSLSFGYLVPEGKSYRDEKTGINALLEIDLFEGTIAPGPVNPETRILSMKSSEELREESTRLEREVAEARIPEIPAPDEPVKTELEKCEERFTKELQEVKAQLAEVLAGFEDLKTKQAAMTDKETKSRSVDPLRKRSEELALEIASGGMSLRKPPVATTTKAEPVDHDAIRRESRDYMFEVLSYSTE